MHESIAQKSRTCPNCHVLVSPPSNRFFTMSNSVFMTVNAHKMKITIISMIKLPDTPISYISFFWDILGCYTFRKFNANLLMRLRMFVFLFLWLIYFCIIGRRSLSHPFFQRAWIARFSFPLVLKLPVPSLYEW